MAVCRSHDHPSGPGRASAVGIKGAFAKLLGAALGGMNRGVDRGGRVRTRGVMAESDSTEIDGWPLMLACMLLVRDARRGESGRGGGTCKRCSPRPSKLP